MTLLPANPAKQVDGHISPVKCHLHDRNRSVGPCHFLSNECHLAPALPLLPVSFNPCSTLELKRPFPNIGRIMSPSYAKPFGGIPPTKDDVQAPRCALQGTVASSSPLLPLSVQRIFLFPKWTGLPLNYGPCMCGFLSFTFLGIRLPNNSQIPMHSQT